MRLAVFSDTHSNIEPMVRAVRTYNPDMVIHLGDFLRDALELKERFPDLDVRYVRGNCDVGMKESDTLELELEGVKIFATHGHRYNVKWGLDSLRNAAWFSGSKVCLFGHTHQRIYLEMGGIQFLNPGTAGEGFELSAALITLESGSAACKIIDIGAEK